MPARDSLAKLLSACSRGDRQAFEELYRRSSPRLYATSLALLKRQDLAEDALQDAFINIWRRASSFDSSKGTAITWMTSIVRNRALDLLRSQYVQAAQVSDQYRDEDFAIDEHNPVTAAETDLAAKAIADCLSELKEPQRRCIMMAYYYGHTHDELSTAMGTPLGTVKAWIRRGMEKLRECLG